MPKVGKEQVWRAMPDFIISVLFLLDGLIVLGLALFADKIGLDPTATWGRGRFILLFFGIALVSVFPLWLIHRARSAKLQALFESKSAKTWFLLLHLWAIVLLIYAWFATYGNFTTWDHSTHYYTQLADAFGKGQLYLDREPDQALLEAPDPFDHTSRPGFDDEMWDLSLYKGNLYLYWGPVPALLITPLQLILGRKITDNFIVFAFFAGLFMVNSLIILKLWKNHFPKIPAWSVIVSILLIGLILPISWSLSIPHVYEAAIGAGQFFLLGGIYFIICAIEPETFLNRKSLFLAGAFWACSVGSRAINVFSVIFLVAVTTLWIIVQLPKPARWKQHFQKLTPLYVPLLMGALVIGWYNWARFASPFEFGLRYQITIFNINRDIGLIFQPEYFLPNLYLYVLHPFETLSRFPFIQPVPPLPVFEKFGMIPAHLYAAGRVTGILFSMPFLFLALVHLFRKDKEHQRTGFFLPVQPYHFILWLLAGSFLINFLGILFYYFGQARFLVDVISQIMLLAITGYWHILLHADESRTIRSKALVWASNGLIIFTLCTSLLLSLTSESGRMQTLNPALFDNINSLLSIPH